MLKVLESVEAAREVRFANEIAVVRSLEHPAIVKLYDSGELGLPTTEGAIFRLFPFFAMRYYEKTLLDLIGENPPLEKKIILSLQLMAAITLLSESPQRYVHRDIKPSNILIDGVECVLADFGVLRLSSDFAIGEEELEGDRQAFARHYPSPELLTYIAGGAPPGPESDVFQAGVVLAEFFTRTKPISIVLNEPLAVKRIQPFGGELGSHVRGVLERMLDTNVEQRISAKEALKLLSHEFSEHCLRNVRATGNPFAA